MSHPRGVSENFESQDANRERVQAMRALALDAALAEVVRFLGPRGIHPLLLKGAGTARWLYDRVYERGYNDIDLLVRPDQFDASLDALRELGFEPEPALGGHHDAVSLHHEVLNRTEPLPVSVELHHSLYMLSAPAQQVWEMLNEDARSIEIAGARVNVPSPPAAALIVVLHAVQHGVAAARPMADLARAVERADRATWRRAAELATSLGAQEPFAAGLRLLAPGRELADKLKLPVDGLPREIRLRAMTPPDTALGVERLMSAKGIGVRLEMIVREVFPSPEFMRVWKPLAKRGTVGLVCAYGWRPFWLVAKLPSGVRAWLKADRVSRGK
ncbi:MAG: nucleotidyltransferase family protein [Solirubrobacteraceae bacterium]